MSTAPATTSRATRKRPRTTEDDTQIEALKEFFDQPWPGVSFTTIRKELRRDVERTGNAYLEVLRNAQDEIVFLRHVDAKMMRLMKLDDAVPVEQTLRRKGAEAKVTVMLAVDVLLVVLDGIHQKHGDQHRLILDVEQPALVDQQKHEHRAAIEAMAGIVGRQILEQRPGNPVTLLAQPLGVVQAVLGLAPVLGQRFRDALGRHLVAQPDLAPHGQPDRHAGHRIAKRPSSPAAGGRSCSSWCRSRA